MYAYTYATVLNIKREHTEISILWSSEVVTTKMSLKQDPLPLCVVKIINIINDIT